MARRIPVALKSLQVLLLLVRLWFALSPSYLHPDENFQGPEVIAGEFYHWRPGPLFVGLIRASLFLSLSLSRAKAPDSHSQES